LSLWKVDSCHGDLVRFSKRVRGTTCVGNKRLSVSGDSSERFYLLVPIDIPKPSIAPGENMVYFSQFRVNPLVTVSYAERTDENAHHWYQASNSSPAALLQGSK
jgi:hypothetical protein